MRQPPPPSRLRAGDGADTTLLDHDFQEGTEPGEYRFTPGTPFAFAPGWGHVTPFVLRDASQFRPRPPYDLERGAYAADFDEVKALGSASSSVRTAEQTEIARFWLESSPLQWNRIARTVAADRGLDPWSRHACSACSTSLSRTATSARSPPSTRTGSGARSPPSMTAATDGNPDTDPDPAWTPLEPTPPIPDHDSAHAVEGSAAATVMKHIFGTDRVAFSACSSTLAAGLELR